MAELKHCTSKKTAPWICEIILLCLLYGIAIPGHGQAGSFTDPANAFAKYNSSNFQEKIYAHTDKSFYVCGEILWFKLYQVDAILNSPVAISSMAYVELFDEHRKPVLQAKVGLENGSGNGSFFLPFSLSSGSYTLRVYTNWMQNFNSEHFFEKPLSIVNTLKRLPVPEKNTAGYNIRFFPEGGNLVAGLRTRVALHAVAINGKGLGCQGVVVNQHNDSITSFSTTKFGMGSFYFTPVKGDVYRAVVKSESGETITGNLPAAYDKGFSLHLAKPDSNTIRVVVSSVAQKDQTVFLLAHTRQVIRLSQAKNLVDGKAEFIINPLDLGEGISHFTLFNENRQPVCERLYFRKPLNKLNVAINADHSDYDMRQKVTMALHTKDHHGAATPADLSVSVFRTDSLQVVDDADIRSYLWLASDLRGSIESPSYYFNAPEEEALMQADHLMLTQGWSRFKWEDILNNTGPAFRFLPEYEGMLISAKVRDKQTGLPAANIKTYLSVAGTKFVLRMAVSNKDGDILFNTGRFYGKTDIIVQTATPNHLIEINSPYSVSPLQGNHHPLIIPRGWTDALLSNSIGAQVENVYTDDLKQQYAIPFASDSMQFFGQPDKTYWLDDYTRFITMEEVMREYVAEVRVRKERDAFGFYVKNNPYNVFFDGEPLLLLDGVPIFDTKKLMQFDPLKIRKLEVIARRYFTGKEGIEGIVSYSTYKGNLDGFVLDPGAIVVNYDGLQLQREFYSPIYETGAQIESPVPDFRNVLFWSPAIHTGTNGEKVLNFYTSDRPGKYAVVVQGITPSGMVGSIVHYFNVNR